MKQPQTMLQAATLRGIAWYITATPTLRNAAHPADIAHYLLPNCRASYWRAYHATSMAGMVVSKENTATVLSALTWATQRGLGRPLHSYDLYALSGAICVLQSTNLSLANIGTTMTTPSPHADTLATRLAALDAALLERDPLMANHLRNIHALLITYPETVHLLKDAEIAMLINAAELHTNTSIIKAVAAKPASSRKAKVSAADL